TPMRSACVVPPAGARRLADYRRKDGLLIPSPGLGVPPGSARRAVAALDVAESPLDLGGGVGLPVGAGAGHLAAGQRLRDAVRAGVAVHRPLVPAALLLPEALQAAPLVGAEAERAEHLLGDGLVGAGRGGAAGREVGGREAVAAGRLLLDDDGVERVVAGAPLLQLLGLVRLDGGGLELVGLGVSAGEVAGGEAGELVEGGALGGGPVGVLDGAVDDETTAAEHDHGGQADDHHPLGAQPRTLACRAGGTARGALAQLRTWAHGSGACPVSGGGPQPKRVFRLALPWLTSR